MTTATGSVRPYLTHPHMLWKWAGVVAMGALTVLVAPAGWWWLVPLGYVLFFPSEYLVHRGVFHALADRGWLGRLSEDHAAHHRDPADLDHIFGYPRSALVSGLAWFAVYWLVAGGPGVAAALALGNFLGLVHYEWVHFTAHRPGARAWTPWGRYLKRFHLWHHYKNEHYWFGVTQPAFDLLFRTHRDHRDVEPSPTVRELVPSDDAAHALEQRR